MAKKVQHRPFQSNRSSHFTVIFDDMMESKAWRQLTAHDILLFLYMLKKFRVKYNKYAVERTNENNITITKQEYTQFMHQLTFEKCIDHLIDLGFIKIVEYRYCTRESTIYGFNDMWKYYGTDKFIIQNEWRRPKNWNK